MQERVQSAGQGGERMELLFDHNPLMLLNRTLTHHLPYPFLPALIPSIRCRPFALNMLNLLMLL